jgi:hypothetical protein
MADELINTLKKIKSDYENAIKSNGTEGVHSLIRSQKLINNIHEFAKKGLMKAGINEKNIFPPINNSGPEINLKGFLKKKKQDVVVLHPALKNDKKNTTNVVDMGVLAGDTDDFPKSIIEKSIVVNVRSQLSSMAKNFDTLMERQFAEPLNLHLRFPKLVMGEIYLMALVGYDPEKTKENSVSWHESFPTQILPLFREINKRNSTDRDFHKYERNCLLLVDFRKDPPEVISTAEELKQLGFITDTKKYSMDGLGVYDFFDDIIEIYKNRHGKTKIFK